MFQKISSGHFCLPYLGLKQANFSIWHNILRVCRAWLCVVCEMKLYRLRFVLKEHSSSSRECFDVDFFTTDKRNQSRAASISHHLSLQTTPVHLLAGSWTLQGSEVASYRLWGREARWGSQSVLQAAIPGQRTHTHTHTHTHTQLPWTEYTWHKWRKIESQTQAQVFITGHSRLLFNF